MTMLRLFLRATSYAATAMIAVLALLPGRLNVDVTGTAEVKHATAYAGTAFLLVVAHQRWVAPTLFLFIYAAVLEYAQHWSPGRHPLVAHFLASSMGAVVGAGIAWTVLSTRWVRS